MINKVQLLLSLRAPQDKDVLVDLLVKEQAAAKGSLPGLQHRRAVRLPGDPTASVPQDGQTQRVTPPPSFDALFELGGDGVPLETLTAAVAGIGNRLGSVIEPTQSAAMVGTEHTIIPGSHSLLLVMALRRRPHLSREEFHDYWRNDHAGEVRESVADLPGYRQFHADERATRAAANAAQLAIDDLEGTAEGYYSSMHEFLQIMARPEVAADAGFIDHARSAMWLYTSVETH